VIDVAVETPETGAGFYGLMTLLGTYVGIVPVILGMLFMPAIRRVSDDWVRLFMAVTIGLLGFLVIDGGLEGLEIGGSRAAPSAASSSSSSGRLSYLVLTAIDRRLKAGIKSSEPPAQGPSGSR
jgi:hypothetical protein